MGQRYDQVLQKFTEMEKNNGWFRATRFKTAESDAKQFLLKQMWNNHDIDLVRVEEKATKKYMALKDAWIKRNIKLDGSEGEKWHNKPVGFSHYLEKDVPGMKSTEIQKMWNDKVAEVQEHFEGRPEITNEMVQRQLRIQVIEQKHMDWKRIVPATIEDIKKDVFGM